MPTVFVLDAPHGPPQLRENYGFAARQLAAIERELALQLIRLDSKWRAIHGE